LRLKIRIGFDYQWPGFSLDIFHSYFPFLALKYDLELSKQPEVVFYASFSRYNQSCWPDARRWLRVMPVLKPGRFVRVFLTGENVEPLMDQCDFAISFSRIVDDPRHLFLPLWVYDIRRWEFSASSLMKREDTDWERVAEEKTKFCNFIYRHPVSFRDAVFTAVNKYRRVDAPGVCQNNMDGRLLPPEFLGKLQFIKSYKFTLAIENSIWPGYATEKFVQPMFCNSIPIYVGDPLAGHSFDKNSYIDFTRFSSFREMAEFVREVDNNKQLYLTMLATPNFRNNEIPRYARDEVMEAFFDRIFAEAIARR
jgi:hypothetical protein